METVLQATAAAGPVKASYYRSHPDEVFRPLAVDDYFKRLCDALAGKGGVVRYTTVEKARLPAHRNGKSCSSELVDGMTVCVELPVVSASRGILQREECLKFIERLSSEMQDVHRRGNKLRQALKKAGGRKLRVWVSRPSFLKGKMKLPQFESPLFNFRAP